MGSSPTPGSRRVAVHAFALVATPTPNGTNAAVALMSLRSTALLLFAAALGVLAVGMTSAGSTPQPASGSAIAVQALASQRPLAGKVVAIDPGHNGRNWAKPSKINALVGIGKGVKKACDTTGTATDSGYTESAFNLSVGKKLRRWLERRGAKVVMTRTNDHGVGPCINRRARIANRAKADVAISIHADGGPASGRGFHIIRPTRIKGLTDDIYGASRRLAYDLRRNLDRGPIPRSTYAGGGNGIDPRSDIGGLRLSDVPKVLAELANMKNRADVRKIDSAKDRKRIARRLGRGIQAFLRR